MKFRLFDSSERPIDHLVDVFALSDHEWRVDDHEDCAGNCAVIGYIERHRDSFEVSPVDAPDYRVSFDNFDSAIDFFDEFLFAEQLGTTAGR